MRVGFLGSLLIEGVAPSMRPRTRTVLAALAVQRGSVISPDTLADAVWGDRLPRSWPKQVQICIWDLRRALGSDTVQTSVHGYRLAADVELDVDLFESLIDRGREFAALGEADRAVATLRSALDLWRGRPFEDLESWPVAQTEIARLTELRRTVQEELVEVRLAAGQHREVVADAEAQVSEQPLRERRWASLALAHYRSGSQGEALRVLRLARRTVADELGLDPGPELVALEASILGQDVALLADERAVASRICPYKGLAAYDIDDAETFFGRDAEIAALLDRMSRVRMLVLAGPSGSGKSSLARAGIVAALNRSAVDAVVFVPGANPDANLSAVLASASGDPVLVVDQLEEIFNGRPAAEVRAFCARLAGYAVDRGRVVATIRSDHLGDLAAEPLLARLVEEGLHLVSPLGGVALRATIEGPAAAAGLRLEPGLVELLVHEADGQPGILPLLSHALVETWERRDGRVLTVEGYLATGEIHGAVARSAEQLYQGLPAEQRDSLRNLLLRLVVPAADGAPMRTHLDAARLRTGVDRDRLLDVLLRARLLTMDDFSIQLAHEALATAWPRLRQWVDENIEGLRLLQHLSRAADEWDSLGRPGSELYRGNRLAAATEWRARESPELTDTEAAFLDTSEAAVHAARASLIDVARRQRQQNRRLRWALLVGVLLLVVASVAGLVAVGQRREAEAQRRDAAVTALASQALGLRSSRRDLAALLAVEAHRLRPDVTSEAALFGTFTASPGVERVVHTGLPLGLSITDAEYLPDGQTVAIGAADGSVQLRDLSTGRVTTLPALSATAGWPGLDVAAGGRYLAAIWRPSYVPESGIVTVWDLQTRQQRFAPVTVDFRIGDVAISADGSSVAVSGGERGRVVILDGVTGRRAHELPSLGRPADATNSVLTAATTFQSDGILLVGSQAGPVRVVDPKTARVIRQIDLPQESSNGYLGLSSDGRTLLAAGNRHSGQYDLATGKPRWTVTDDRCNARAIIERLGIEICGEWTGRVNAFDLNTGVQLGDRFDSQQGSVCALAINPAGDRLVEVASCNSDDVTIIEWRLDGGGPISRLLTKTPSPVSIGPLGTNGLLAEYSSVPDGPSISYRVDLATGEQSPMPGMFGFVPSSDPDVAVVGYENGSLLPTFGRYDLRRRQPAGPTIDPHMPIYDLWSDGRIAVVRDGTDAQKIRTFDLATGQATGWSEDTPEQQNATNMVLVGKDAYVAWLVSANLDTYSIQRRDVRTGQVLASSPPGYRTFAVNAGRVVGATVDGILTELDATTLAPVGPPFPGTNGAVDSLAIDQRGQRLLAFAGDQSLRLYDIPTRTPIGDPVDTGAVERQRHVSRRRVGGCIGQPRRRRHLGPQPKPLERRCLRTRRPQPYTSGMVPIPWRPRILFGDVPAVPYGISCAGRAIDRRLPDRHHHVR